MKKMDTKIFYKPIESSNIVGYNYSKGAKKLFVKFKNEREYRYDDVTEEEFQALIAEGASFGKVLYATIVNKKKFEEIW